MLIRRHKEKANSVAKAKAEAAEPNKKSNSTKQTSSKK